MRHEKIHSLEIKLCHTGVSTNSAAIDHPSFFPDHPTHGYSNNKTANNAGKNHSGIFKTGGIHKSDDDSKNIRHNSAGMGK